MYHRTIRAPSVSSVFGTKYYLNIPLPGCGNNRACEVSQGRPAVQVEICSAPRLDWSGKRLEVVGRRQLELDPLCTNPETTPCLHTSLYISSTIRSAPRTTTRKFSTTPGSANCKVDLTKVVARRLTLKDPSGHGTGRMRSTIWGLQCGILILVGLHLVSFPLR
jgi:hypothetical protein